jgi:signal transduction histidine kinase
MGNISDIIFGNEYSLYFFYGLAFVITGFLLLMKVQNKVELGKRVWLLAGFALIHGIGELLHSWIYLQRNYIFYYDVSWAFLFERILISSSFMLLFYFGIELVLIVKPELRFLRVVPALIWAGWMGYFIGWKLSVNEATSGETVYFGIVTSRYFLGFPSSVITAIGLFMQLKTGYYLSVPRLERYIKVASAVFAFYGIMAGLVVRPGDFFPANIINTDNLIKITGIPVEVFRTVCAMIIAYFVIKFLQLVDYEVMRRLEKAEINQAVFEERARISGDIHDGVLQSIYSVGLRLEKCMLTYKKELNEEQVKDMQFAVNKLNDVMMDIRQFIRHLTVPVSYPDIQTIVAEVTEEFRMHPEYKFKASLVGKPFYLDNNKLVNIYYFVKEGLSNVRKHSKASNVALDVCFKDDGLKIRIKDDGVGFVSGEDEKNYSGGMGLKNMYERAERLNGRLTLKSRPGLGTELLLDISA